MVVHGLLPMFIIEMTEISGRYVLNVTDAHMTYNLCNIFRKKDTNQPFSNLSLCIF
jgi:hypothetical protein